MPHPTKEQHEEIWRLLDVGVPKRTIARRIGLHPLVIFRTAKAPREYKAAGVGIPTPIHLLEQAHRLIMDGHTVKSACASLGLRPGTVQRYRRLQYPTKPGVPKPKKTPKEKLPDPVFVQGEPIDEPWHLGAIARNYKHGIVDNPEHPPIQVVVDMNDTEFMDYIGGCPSLSPAECEYLRLCVKTRPKIWEFLVRQSQLHGFSLKKKY